MSIIIYGLHYAVELHLGPPQGIYKVAITCDRRHTLKLAGGCACNGFLTDGA